MQRHQLTCSRLLRSPGPGEAGEAGGPGRRGRAGGLAALKTVWPSGQGGDWNSTGSGRAGARIPQPSLSSSLHSFCTRKSPSRMLVEGSHPSLPLGPVADRQRIGIEPLCITAPRELKSRPDTSLSHPGLCEIAHRFKSNNHVIPKCPVARARLRQCARVHVLCSLQAGTGVYRLP